MKSVLAVLVTLIVAADEARAQGSIDALNLTTYVVDQDSSRVEGDRAGRDENPWHGTVRLFLGGKDLNEAEWSPVESQGEFAILSNFGAEDWDVHLALDLRFAASDVEDFLGEDVISASYEINFGVRKIFDTGSFVRPFLGGGLAFGGATFEIEDVDEESDDGVGVWFDAGIDFSLGGPISLGFEISLSAIPIKIEGIRTDAGGLRFGLTLGFSW